MDQTWDESLHAWRRPDDHARRLPACTQTAKARASQRGFDKLSPNGKTVIRPEPLEARASGWPDSEFTPKPFALILSKGPTTTTRPEPVEGHAPHHSP